jgi:hypothetical protein
MTAGFSSETRSLPSKLAANERRAGLCRMDAGAELEEIEMLYRTRLTDFLRVRTR